MASRRVEVEAGEELCDEVLAVRRTTGPSSTSYDARPRQGQTSERDAAGRSAESPSATMLALTSARAVASTVLDSPATATADLEALDRPTSRARRAATAWTCAGQAGPEARTSSVISSSAAGAAYPATRRRTSAAAEGSKIHHGGVVGDTGAGTGQHEQHRVRLELRLGTLEDTQPRRLRRWVLALEEHGTSDVGDLLRKGGCQGRGSWTPLGPRTTTRVVDPAAVRSPGGPQRLELHLATDDGEWPVSSSAAGTSARGRASSSSGSWASTRACRLRSPGPGSTPSSSARSDASAVVGVEGRDLAARHR